MTIKISFLHRWSKDGTHYNQTVSMNREQWDKATRKIKKPLDRWTQTKRGLVVFSNLTERDIIAKSLGLRLLDRNTCFIIRDLFITDNIKK